MNNVLLDPLPEEWEGADGMIYPLETSFRIGIQICLVQEDPELTQFEKLLLIRDLLFVGYSPGNQQELSECINFFLHGWYHDNEPDEKENQRLMDFNIDQWRIYSAFRQHYGINLNEADMHWWEFMGMLSCLPKCAYTQVVDIRQRKFKPKMDREERKSLEEAKQIYTLDTVVSVEEKQINDNLYDFLGGTNYGDAEKKRVEAFEKFAE